MCIHTMSNITHARTHNTRNSNDSSSSSKSIIHVRKHHCFIKTVLSRSCAQIRINRILQILCMRNNVNALLKWHTNLKNATRTRSHTFMYMQQRKVFAEIEEKRFLEYYFDSELTDDYFSAIRKCWASQRTNEWMKNLKFIHREHDQTDWLNEHKHKLKHTLNAISFRKVATKKKSVVCCLLQLSHVFRFAMKRLFLRIK